MFKWAGHEDGSKDPLYILRVRIGMRKIHDQSLFVHPLCMFYVYIGYICDDMLYMLYVINVCVWMPFNLYIGYVNWLICKVRPQ